MGEVSSLKMNLKVGPEEDFHGEPKFSLLKWECNCPSLH